MTAVTYIYPPVEVNPDSLYQQFVAYMQTNVDSEYAPANGNLDDWIARAWSFIAAQLMEISSDVATSIFRYFGAYIVNEPPNSAAPATGLTTWTMTDSAGYTIPAGAQVYFTDSHGGTQQFATTADVVVAAGQTTATGVPVIAALPGSAANNITGTGQLVTSEAFVASVALTQPTASGVDEESDTDYLNRLATLFQTLSPKMVTARGCTLLALEQPGVGRALTIDTFDPANITVTGDVSNGSPTIANCASAANVPVGAQLTGANIPAGAFVLSVGTNSLTMSANATGSATGESITVAGSLNNGGKASLFVTDSNGNALGSTAMASIATALAGSALSNFKLNVLAPTYTTVNVAMTVYAWPGQNPTAIGSAVQAAIQAYVNPATWGTPPANSETGPVWLQDQAVRLASVEHAALGVQGVHYVSALTLNGSAADVPLPGVVALPQLGTLSVTVNLG